MRIKCIHNSLTDLPEELQGFAFSQISGETQLDITPGKEYDVYGVRENDLGKFYLVLTDKIYTKMPWFMPASLYEVTDNSVPKSWVEKTDQGDFGKEHRLAPDIYFGHEEDIEDGTDLGYEVFQKMRQEITPRDSK
ncbi:MAG: hypothetical protein JWN01_215 [Patescibacteria group bacterium]|nr:hypothetical protein [Patescibacteria group bacterium]